MGGAYLITDVSEDDGTVELELETPSMARGLLAAAVQDDSAEGGGPVRIKDGERVLELEISAALEQEGWTRDNTRLKLLHLEKPVSVTLRVVGPDSSAADDKIVACNLTRPLASEAALPGPRRPRWPPRGAACAGATRP
eukprot:SRR837773.14089.p1 GENE.SRR837773.14089~~SRR837773.14089.p1  ORF type:complete len:159 (+),score=41.73 SRR837773.14089:62-478(+)